MMGDDTKKRIAIFSIFTGNYSVFYKQFVKSIAFDFLPDCDKHFFICTDKELSDYKCVRGKVTQYVIDDMPFPYITLLRYKIFNEQINDAINDYDYLFFLNSNARCFTQITCSDINLENDYTFTLHDNHLDESIDEKPFERNSISTACFSDSWVNPEYVGGRFFGAKPSKFKEMFLALEKNVEKDLENDFISVWWDEGHLNWFYNTHKENLSHNLLSVNYHVQEQHDHRECFNDKKMWYVDKNKRRYKKYFNKSRKFDQIFCNFADRHNIKYALFSDEKLDEFCEKLSINLETKYEEISNNPKLMHSFVCFLQTDELREKTKNKILPIKTDSVVIIPEDRILPHIEFVIRNVMNKLPQFAIRIVCTSTSLKSMQEFCYTINESIQVVSVDLEKFTQNSYNNLFLSKDFWNSFDEENILIYQQDAMLFHDQLNEFLDYDYIGAPWLPNQTDNSVGVGNGGFSFRKKSKLIKCLETIKPSELELSEDTQRYIESTKLDNPPEDVYFSKTMLDFNIGKVADAETAKKFSEERVYSPDSFGGHQYWLANCDTMFRLFNAYELYDWAYFNGESSAHRGGWKSLLQYMLKNKYLRKDCGIALLDILEKYFVWDRGDVIEREWVGISHMTPNTPPHLQICHIDKLLESENFLNSLKYCKALVVLSDYMKAYIESKLDDSVNIITLKHPVIGNIKKFEMNKFLQNPNKKVIALGQQMRSISSIYKLKSSYDKVWMYGHPDKQLMYHRRDEEIKMLNLDVDVNSVEMMFTKSFKKYDNLITTNIVLIDLIDASANNAVLEMISANIPFFVKKLPAIFEYVGNDYPMFFTDLSEVEEKLKDEEKLKELYAETHEYLLNFDKSDLDYDYFSKKLLKLIN